MVSYNLNHLTQPDNQAVVGPIQDDEALLLFALIRCMRLKRVLEVGGLNGYSAANFLHAVGPTGIVYTVDREYVRPISQNHLTFQKDCRDLSRTDLGDDALHLIFFDCHVYDAQMTLYSNLLQYGLITHRTVLVLHDTNLHPHTDRPGSAPRPWGAPLAGGWMHQDVERKMVNKLRNDGYDSLMVHTSPDRHDATLPFRHGLTILTRAFHLDVGEMDRVVDGQTYVGNGLTQSHEMKQVE